MEEGKTGGSLYDNKPMMGISAYRNLEADLKQFFTKAVKNANTQFIGDYGIDPSNMGVHEDKIK